MRFYVLFTIIFSLLIVSQCEQSKPKIHRAYKENHLPYFLHPSLELVYSEIMNNGILFSEIVLRQAIIETGWFTSYNCRVRKNLFGMKGGQKTEDNPNGYAIYSTWQESVKAYKEWQDRNYTERFENYYEFLEFIGYAESTEYIRKLKSINLVVVKV